MSHNNVNLYDERARSAVRIWLIALVAVLTCALALQQKLFVVWPEVAVYFDGVTRLEITTSSDYVLTLAFLVVLVIAYRLARSGDKWQGFIAGALLIVGGLCYAGLTTALVGTGASIASNWVGYRPGGHLFEFPLEPWHHSWFGRQLLLDRSYGLALILSAAAAGLGCWQFFVSITAYRVNMRGFEVVLSNEKAKGPNNGT